KEMYLKWVEGYFPRLKDVPVDYPEYDEICATTVQRNPEAIIYVSEPKRTETMYLRAIEEDILSLSEIPEKYKITILNLLPIEKLFEIDSDLLVAVFNIKQNDNNQDNKIDRSSLRNNQELNEIYSYLKDKQINTNYLNSYLDEVCHNAIFVEKHQNVY